jgi:hypothetical protein
LYHFHFVNGQMLSVTGTIEGNVDDLFTILDWF